MLKMVYVNGGDAEVGKIFADDLKNKDWERCLVPEKLGVPFKVKRFRHRYPNKNIKRDLGIFLMVDPKTGFAHNKWQIECGKIGFARTDSEDFTVELYYELFDYIYTLMDYYGEINDEPAKAMKRMTPAAFKRYADQTRIMQKNYKEAQSLMTPTVYESNSEPKNNVKLAYCSNCQKHEARLRCSACKKAHYCDIECQRNDWKKHKLECK